MDHCYTCHLLYLCICNKSVALRCQVGSRQFDLFRKQQISIASQEMEDVTSSTGNETHQLLKACRQCTLLACTHLNVLEQHTEKENCHARQTVCTLQSHRKWHLTYLTRVVRVLYVRVSPLSSVMELVPCSRSVWTSSLNAVRRVPSCSVTAFSIGSCLFSVCVASPTHQEPNIIIVII